MTDDRVNVWASPQQWWRIATIVVTVCGLLTGDYTPVWFTSQSLILMLVFLVATVFRSAQTGSLQPPAPRLRGAITAYVLVTCLVSHFINNGGASPFPGLVVDDPFLVVDNWSVFLMHYIAPIMFVVDWLLWGRHRVAWRDGLLWVLYPLAYGVVMVTRGLLFPAIHNRFPYFFVDPITDGWGAMLLGMLQVLVFVLVISAAVIGLGKLSDRVFGRSRDAVGRA